MPKINKRSEWRQTALKHYQKPVMAELPRLVKPKTKWLVKDIWHRFESLNHLSDSYAFDIAIAICRQAYEDGVLEKLGKYYKLKETKPSVAIAESVAHV